VNSANEGGAHDAAPGDKKEILNIEEASAFLGVSTKTFQKVLREGDMPGRKVGREWKFWRRALAEWVGRGRSRDFLDSGDSEAGPDASSGSPPSAAATAAPASMVARAGAGVGNGARSAAGRHATSHRSLEAEED
jgi:excisionase family DNA binding protein